MSPEDIAKNNSESAHQKAFFCYLARAATHGFDIADDMGAYKSSERLIECIAYFNRNRINLIPATELAFAFAVPNGGERSGKFGAAAAGSKLKAEGVKKGVPDVCIPIRNRTSAGLWIEFKEPDGGTVSSEQGAYYTYLNLHGYTACFVSHWRDAVLVLKAYIRNEIVRSSTNIRF